MLPLLVMFLLLAGGSGTGIAAVSMPKFSLPSVIDGKMVASTSFKDQVLLVTFFATWCPPCRQEIPSLKQLQEELGSRGFSVLAFSVDEGGPGIVAQLVKQQKINYPVMMSDRATAVNFGGIQTLPTSFLINRQGHVVKTYVRYTPHALFKRDIEAIMEK
jgi:thiol-disulfide isomerase/thioredoxin